MTPVESEAPGAGVGSGIVVSDGALGTLEDEAVKRYPEECCGALLGRAAADGTRVVVRALPLANERASERKRRYLLGPEEVSAADAEARRRGLELLGFFHSHPDAPGVPSAFDREHAWPWYSYLIVPVRDGIPGRARGWRLKPDRSAFVEDQVLARTGDDTSEETP